MSPQVTSSAKSSHAPRPPRHGVPAPLPAVRDAGRAGTSVKSIALGFAALFLFVPLSAAWHAVLVNFDAAQDWAARRAGEL